MVIQDADFFFEDGDVFLQVEDVIFKVHRFMLSSRSSVMKTMFALPQNTTNGEQQTEGSCIEAPIFLPDTKAQFTSLLWALYKLPQLQLTSLKRGPEYLTLTNLVKISHKYEFTLFQNWAKTELVKVLDLNSYPTLPTHPVELSQLLEVSQLTGDSRLHLHALRLGKKHGEKNGWRSAVQIAERCGHPELRGFAYYKLLCETTRLDATESDTQLSPDQELTMLHGLRNIVAFHDKCLSAIRETRHSQPSPAARFPPAASLSPFAQTMSDLAASSYGPITHYARAGPVMSPFGLPTSVREQLWTGSTLPTVDILGRLCQIDPSTVRELEMDLNAFFTPSFVMTTGMKGVISALQRADNLSTVF